MLRVCVIGLGPIGNRHADNYVKDELAELIGVCDINKERADSASARLHVKGFYDTETMLRELQPDLVSVTTGGYEYGSDHYKPAMQALEAGCHVLCEKPLCNDVAKAREMVTKAMEKGVCFGTNLNHRFTDLTRRAKDWVDSGKLGHILFMNMAMWINNPAESSPYFHLKALHPHTINVMQYFCGPIDAVQCFAVKAPGRSIWSTAQFNMKFRSGVLGHLTGSYDIPRGHPMERTEVAGTMGRFVLTDMFRELCFYPSNSDEVTQITNSPFWGMARFEDTFTNRIHRFLEQVSEGAKPEEIDGSGAEGLAAQEVIQAAIESLNTGTVVQVERATF
jgi:predicted dehydrogenase